MSKKIMMMLLVGAVLFGLGGAVMSAMAQDVGAAAADAVTSVAAGDAPAAATGDSPSFWTVISGSGALGIILWTSLLLCSIACMALVVDAIMNVREKKISPPTLVAQVQEAMELGDLLKALKYCEDEPGPLANILTAGFSNVEEGFDAIQDAVGVAADQESERTMQRVNYLNVVGNLSPSLGLLGTVQGMIFAFATLATQTAGAGQQAALALNISQALYTTAAGLCISVPAVAFYSFFKNRATNIILSMEAMTMDLIKVLRNVEVVEG